jgi:hypothetical protein
MTITIPDETLGDLRLTSEQTRMEIAVGLFADRRVTLARCENRGCAFPHLSARVGEAADSLALRNGGF